MLNAQSIKKIDPALILRIGLGGTLIYAGSSILMNTQSWLGFIPRWIINLSPVSSEVLLTGHGIFELILGIVLVSGFFLRLSSLITFFDFLFIIVFVGVDLVTFRDFGLLMAALALFIISLNRKPKEQS